MYEYPLKMSTGSCKYQEQRKPFSSRDTATSNQNASNKQHRRAGNPVKSASPSKLINGSHGSLVCKNSACRALLTSDDTFCKRCSCCICHLFDDNKDPSLWLVCISESAEADSCGLSCHIECALQRQKVGVVNLGHLIQLDGSYCCASCGKVSGIIEYWKKQLVIARDARRVDVLCYRIFLSHRLLSGTLRFKELHEIVEEAKGMLEKELGPLNGVSMKMGRGIVSRLAVSTEVQKLCSHAIERADEWLSTASCSSTFHREDFLPAACSLQFENVTSSSLVMVVRELASASMNNVKNYKLWYYKSHEQLCLGEPVYSFPRNQRRFLISNLQPCTEYTFCVVSFTDSGRLGHSEAKCFTKSVELIHKNASPLKNLAKSMNLHRDICSSKVKDETKHNISSHFSIRDLGNIIEIAWAQLDDDFPEPEIFSMRDCFNECGINPHNVEEGKQMPVSRQLDLNVVTVPDLNADVSPLESSCFEEDIGCTSGHATETEDNVCRANKNGETRPDSNSDWIRQTGKVPAVESRVQLCDRQATGMKEDACDDGSTVINWPALFTGKPSCLDMNYEHCVKIIRWLECGGHIQKDFRVKFLTWFSLKATEQERRVVNAFIRALEDDPASLVDQLMDSFGDVIKSKRPRNGFCTKLWH